MARPNAGRRNVQSGGHKAAGPNAGEHILSPYHQLNSKGPQQQTTAMLKSHVMKEATRVQQHLYHSHHWHHWYHLHHAWLWGTYAYLPGTSANTVVRVPSGNSLSITNSAGVPQLVRLAGVGAPVVGQALFSESRDNLNSIANGQQVRVVPVGTDFTGDMVAQVFLNSGEYVNETQIRSGLAWNAVEDGFDMSLAGAEQAAQMSGAGMWNGDYAPAN